MGSPLEKGELPFNRDTFSAILVIVMKLRKRKDIYVGLDKEKCVCIQNNKIDKYITTQSIKTTSNLMITHVVHGKLTYSLHFHR